MKNKNPVAYFMIFSTLFFLPMLFFTMQAIYAGLISLFFVLILIAVYNSSEVREYKLNRSFKYITNYQIPQDAILSFNRKRKLNTEQLQNTTEALKQFFMIYSVQIHEKNYQKYAMTSKVADELWHEFMLYSKDYAEFCEKAFGHFLHHTPDSFKSNNELIKVNFEKTFNRDVLVTYDNLNKINKHQAIYFISSTPLIFALDSYLKIDDGFHYNQESILQMEKQMKIHNNTPKDNRDTSNSGSGDLAYSGSGTYFDSSTDSGGSSCGGGCGGGGD